jgi:hypothetical protein
MIKKQQKIEDFLKDFFSENLSYKLVSLFIALILWFTILGRRDFTTTKSIEIEVLVAKEYVLTAQSVDSVKVKVSGPRTALNRFINNGLSQIITLDVSNRPEGEYDISIPDNKIDVPFGVKVLQVTPKTVKVQIRRI